MPGELPACMNLGGCLKWTLTMEKIRGLMQQHFWQIDD
jgi:hypothetical protein